ncbi:MAG: Fic family protein [Pseudomonadota bacterium]
MSLWEHPDWPAFRWDPATLQPRLDAVRLAQGRLLGQSEAVLGEQEQAIEIDALVRNAMQTSEIEGEHLAVVSVRSSVARRLGLERGGSPDRSTAQTDALAALLVEATRHPERPLTRAMLCQWQAALFPEGPGVVSPIRVGELRGEQPMQVVSGRIDRPRIHFEAPPRSRLEGELDAFLAWFNAPPVGLDGLLRAGIAHLWLITLHPFDDGNGRVTRAVTDRALAQAEGRSIRLYALSAAIMEQRRDYYGQLERVQQGDLDITAWLQWFLEALERSLEQALGRVGRVLEKARFWQRHAGTILHERQVRALNRLLDREEGDFPGGINASQYGALAKVSKATATRDLTDLLEKGCLYRLPGGGRSTRYEVAMAPALSGI